MKIGIGTVQFGMPYGISNELGIPSLEEIKKILKMAATAGVRTIDTASLYGTSEEALGRALPSGHSFEIVTKTPKFPIDRISKADVDQLENTLLASLQKLKQESVYGLLFHRPGDLFSQDGELLMEKASDLKARGLVKKIGISVDGGATQIDRVLANFSIDLVQVPVNILDQRLIQSGHLKLLKSKGVEIHARSAFLQGLLLMNPNEIKKTTEPFKLVKPHLQKLRGWAQLSGVSMLEAALGFVVGIDEIDRVILGVCAEAQLAEILASDGVLAKKAPDFGAELSKYAWNDEKILNPALW